MGADVKHRYYRARVYVFCVAGVVLTRVSMFVTEKLANIEVGQLITMSLLIIGLWFSVGRLAFDLDPEAAVTGRMKKDCIMKYAGGNRVTASILAL